LIRSILSDPRAFDPKQLGRVAGRWALLQDPVSPPGLVAEAIERLSTFFRTAVAREAARSDEVRRGFSWSIGGWPGADATVFQGQADLLYRGPSGDRILVIESHPGANASSERVRLLLSAVAFERSGIGPIRRAWRVEMGTEIRVEGVDGFEPRTIENAIETMFADPSI
jgi:hypothetical protein